MLAIVQALVDNLPILIPAAIQLVTGLAYGILAALPILIGMAPQIIQSLVNAIVANLPLILYAAASIIAMLAMGIVNDLPALMVSVGRICQTILTPIQNLNEQLSNIGTNLVDGLWSGIKSAWAGMITKITGLVNLLPAAVKLALGIQSPSTVFAGIGKNMALGLDVGFAEQMSQVEKRMRLSVAGLSGPSMAASAGGSGSTISHNSESYNFWGPVTIQGAAGAQLGTTIRAKRY